MATIRNVTKLNYINKRILKRANSLIPGEIICLDAPDNKNSNTIYRFLKLIEANDNYYFIPCNHEGLLCKDDLTDEVSMRYIDVLYKLYGFTL